MHRCSTHRVEYLWCTYEQLLIQQLEGLPVGGTGRIGRTGPVGPGRGGCVGCGRGGCVVTTHPLGSVHV